VTFGQRSQQLFQQALKYTPTGTHSNTRMRSPHPHYIAEAHGAYVTDVDGRRFLDCIMGNGSILLGHDNPPVREAVRRAVDRGTTTGLESPDAVASVELLAELVPGTEAVRFANTGTEAVLHALQIARAATGRTRIAKAEASYHGWADQVWVSTWPPLSAAGPATAPAPVPGSAGLAREASRTLVLPFNDVAATTELLREQGNELAAVIVEPAMIDIGYVPATRAYLRALRDLTARLGIVLIFDELLTGFRLAPGGAREYYDIRPDLSTYGKAIANGYPLAAVEGRRDLLDLTDPGKGGEVGWVGTYNGHAIAMAAARATLAQLRDGAVHRRMKSLAERLRGGAAGLAGRFGQPVVVAGEAGHFQPYFCPSPPTNYREAATTDAARFRRFFRACEDRQVIVAQSPLGHSALSAAHTDEDVDTLLDCLAEALAAVDETPARTA
jgi:glutamate-1-semialdehyde 2,1-aminomutase